MSDITKLKVLAEAAVPGVWECREAEGSSAVCWEKGWVADSGTDQDIADNRFIAAANPAAVLELIAEIERLKTLRSKTERDLEQELEVWRHGPFCWNCGDTGDVHNPVGEWLGECDCLAAQLIGANRNIDQLKTENTDLHATLQAAKGEIERLRLDNQSKNGSLKALGKKLKDRERQLRKLGGVAGENEALRQQLAVPSDVLADAEALRMDAERYRYVRKHSYVEVRCDSPRKNGWSPELLDVCVDAAISKDSAHD